MLRLRGDGVRLKHVRKDTACRYTSVLARLAKQRDDKPADTIWQHMALEGLEVVLPERLVFEEHSAHNIRTQPEMC